MIDLGPGIGPNEGCKDCGLRGQGLLMRRFAFGVKKDRHMLACRTTRRILGLDKDAVRRVVRQAGERCATELEDLLVQLSLTEVQLDEP